MSAGRRRPGRPGGRRRVDAVRRPDGRDAPRRHRRRGDQGRAPARPDPARGHGPRRTAGTCGGRRSAATSGPSPLDLSTRGRRGGASGGCCATADVADRELPPGHPGAVGARPTTPCPRANPGLVLARVTGFGQIGPYRSRPGFGTLAEAMSGFAAVTGEPDGPPTLPPFGLADGIASLATAYAIMSALHRRAGARGAGQVVDMAIIEPILAMLGPQITRWDQLGTVQPRHGQPVRQQRAAQHLPDRRRPVGRSVHERADHRRAGHAARRPAGPHRRAVVRHRTPAGRSTPTSSTRPSAAGSPAAPATR